MPPRGNAEETQNYKELVSPGGHMQPASAGTHLVWHECRDGASNLVVVDVGGGWAQQEEKELNRDRNLQHWLEQDRLLQPHKRHGGLVQETHAACSHSRETHWTQSTYCYQYLSCVDQYNAKTLCYYKFTIFIIHLIFLITSDEYLEFSGQ